MSKLDELIKELCPDGVEYKIFDEICTLHARIGWQRLTRAEYLSSGDYMLITGTDFTESHAVNYLKVYLITALISLFFSFLLQIRALICCKMDMADVY